MKPKETAGATASEILAWTYESSLREEGLDEAYDRLFGTFDDLFKAGRFGVVDEVLSAADPDRLSESMMVGIAAFAFAGRRDLPSYPAAVEQFHAAIAAAKGDDHAAKVMAGLRRK